MDDGLMEGLFSLDKDVLMKRMSSELPLISGAMGLTTADVAFRTGLDKDRMKLIAAGKRRMKWSEYMSILFFLWDDDRGSGIAEERGLFPPELKAAMAVNRNVHDEDIRA